jgi:hypothetical protein
MEASQNIRVGVRSVLARDYMAIFTFGIPLFVTGGSL